MIELRHIIYLPEVGNLADLLKQDVKAIVDKKGNLYRILSEKKVEKINFKNDFTFTDFLTGQTYEVRVKDGKCHLKCSSSSTSSTSCCKPKPPCPDPTPPLGESLFKVSTYLYNLDNLTSGPITLHKREDLNLWSTGAIVMTAKQGSVDVQFELRNQIIAARDPVPAVDFTGYTSNGIFYNSLAKTLYLYNGNGTFTLVDLSGSVSVLINQTTFVDPVYGTLAGVNDDLTAAFQTLAQGVAAAAVSPRTIYVQPGTYTLTAPLVLRTGINWFFAEGAVVNSTASSIFTDNGANVITSITGYGEFNVIGTGVNVLNLTGGSNIIFEAQKVSMGAIVGSVLFEYSPAAALNLLLNVNVPQIVIGNSTGIVFHQLNGSSIVSFKSNLISAPTIASINGTATGTFDLEVSYLEGTAFATIGDNLTVGAMFLNLTDTYTINVSAQDITSNAGTQMIIIGNTTPTSSPASVNVTANTLASYGGIVWAVGADTTQLISLQPMVNLTVDILEIVGTNLDIVPFNVDLANLTTDIKLYSNIRLDTITYNVQVSNGANVLLNIDEFSVSSGAFIVGNVGPTLLNITNLVVNSKTISCLEQLLFTANEVNVELNSQSISCTTSTPFMSPISTNGVVPTPPPVSLVANSVTINAGVLFLNAIGTVVLNTNIISHNAGVLNMNVVFFSPSGVFYNAIYIGPTLPINTLVFKTVASIEGISNFLFAEGTADIDIGTIALGIVDPGSNATAFEIQTAPGNLGVTGKIDTIVIQGLGNAFNLSLNGSFTGSVGNIIFITGTGNAISMTDDSRMNANINFIIADSGSVIATDSTGNSYIRFGEFNSNASQLPYDLEGTGRIQLIGNAINFGDAPGSTEFYLANVQTLNLDVQYINSNECDYIVYTDNSSRADINFNSIITNGNVATILFNSISASFLNLIGNELNLNQASSSSVVFQSDQNSTMVVKTEVLNLNSVNIIAQSTFGSFMSLQYRRLTMGNPGCNVAFLSTDSSRMNVVGFSSDIRGPGTASSMIQAYLNSVFIGNFESFIVTTATDTGISVLDDASLTATFQTLNTQGNNLIIFSTGPSGKIWVKADRWLTNNASNVYIPTGSVIVEPVTVGGYMNAGGSSYNIEYSAGAYGVPLRLLSSILVSTLNSIFSPVSTPNVSLAPSSATMTTFGPFLFPAVAFFVDPGVF